jgi:hypothetical protein
VYFFIVHNIYNKLRKDYMQLDYIVQEEVRRVLNEIYKRSNNSILELGANAVSKKKKYAKTLWNKIQQVYSYIGGCKSFDSINGDDGFTDFLYGNYVWRIYFGDSAQDIKAATIYKPTQYGRKRICSFGNDVKSYNKIIDKDFDKSNHVYGEVSGKAERFLQKDKRTNWIPKEEVPTYLFGKKIELDRQEDIDKQERIPYDATRHYYRKLGDDTQGYVYHRKSMYGNPIKRK